MTDTSSPAATLIRTMYEDALAGRLPEAFAVIADDFVLEEPPGLPYGGTYHGPDGLQQLFAQAATILDFATMRVEYIFGDDLRACAVITCDLRASGERATLLEEWLVRDGRVVRGRVFWFDPALAGG